MMMMNPIQDFVEHSTRLIDPDISIETRLQLVTDVRDNLAINHTAEYLNFLNCYFKALLIILLEITKPQFTDNQEHKLRNIVIEILNRFPHSEVLRPFVQDLLKLAMQVLTTDNEDNGLICIRIIFDLLRNFQPTLENDLQPFLDFVCKIYQNFSLTVRHVFENPAIMVAVPPDATPGGADDITSGQFNPSTRSLKILAESPALVMFLFESCSLLVQTNILHLLPLMVSSISVSGPEKVPPHLKMQFLELKVAQVKTVSFLTYLLKSFTDYIRPHEESISNSMVNLLVTCPDSVSVRKELLLALKDILGTDFERGLFPLIGTLLDENVLVGTGRACYETLRPLAYTLLAEIVHRVRADLSLSQLSRIIYLFSGTMHDTSMPLNIHSTCAWLMLNLVEPIYEQGVGQTSMDDARVLLIQILDSFVGKFRTLKRSIPQLMDEGEEGMYRASLKAKLELPVQAVLKSQVSIEHTDEIRDCRHLVKTLIMGMKTIFRAISHVFTPHSQVGRQMLVSSSSGFSGFKGLREDEVWKVCGVLKSGVYCLVIFTDTDEEKGMIGHFSNSLAVLEPRDLMDVFSICMPELFECTLLNNHLVIIFSTLLQQVKVPFANVLINFLVSSKLDVLENPDSPEAKLVLHLSNLLFRAITKFPPDSERILLPHLPIIIEVCMKNTTELEKPIGYLQLLRTVFHALSIGESELILRELIPTLHPCLNILLAILEGPAQEDKRDLLLELCLTLPASLSSLLPFLPRLMKPLVLCLKASYELVSLGLRTLEFWIDSLNPDFLSSMVSVMAEVILALRSHLRPAPYPWGGKSKKLLGKLSGRNKHFIRDPLALQCKENTYNLFEPRTPFLFPLDCCINLAVATVTQKNGPVEIFYRKQALKFLHVSLSAQLNLSGKESGESFGTGRLSTLLSSNCDLSWERCEILDVKADLELKIKKQLLVEKSVFKSLLMIVISSRAEPDLIDMKDDFVVNVCRHFALMFHVYNASTQVPTTSADPGPVLNRNVGIKPRSSACSNFKDLDPLIFLDALVDVLSDEDRLHAKAALNALNVFAESLIFLARLKHNDVKKSKGEPATPVIVISPSMNLVYPPPPSVYVPIFEQLLPRLLHLCYGVTWQAQMGGVAGLGALMGKVHVEILCLFQVKIVRGLIYVLKRLPVYANKELEETTHVLMHVLRIVNSVDEANGESQRQSSQGAIEYLASECFNANASIYVKKIVQSCLALLASRTGTEVFELLEPLYQPLLQSLIMRPLCTKTVDEQVETITGLNFCLSLRPPLLKLTEELVSFLLEALHIADTEETEWVPSFINPKVANKLRTVCVELLCTVMAWTDFVTANLAELHSKIISMLIKSLTCHTPEIVAFSKEGLRQVIQEQRMPKELLRTSLRPIFDKLAYTRNLSMPLLQGVAHLLELLSTWFDATLGEKLLEHLKKWLEPEKIAQSQKAWKAGEEPKIAAAIIELFHLLPNAAGKFLDELVSLTIDLEEALPPGQFYSEINSPFRLPLTKFLNRYHTAAVDYFLARLCEPKYFRRFMYIIKSDAGQPLREELAKSAHKIIASAFTKLAPKSDPLAISESLVMSVFQSVEEGLSTCVPKGSCVPSTSSGTSLDAYFQGLVLVKTLVKLMPSWLQNNRNMFDTLVAAWKSPERISRLHKERELNLVQVKESKWLVKCFLNYLRRDKYEVNMLFHILSIFLYHTRIDFTFLKEFYIVEVGEGYQPNLKKTILVHFLDIFRSKKLSQDHLVVIMQMLVLPTLSHAFQNGQSSEVVDPSIVKIIVDMLLDAPDEVSAEYDEPLRIELLQLSTLLMKYLQSDLVHHRRQLIRFGWNHLKREGSASKQWAFVNVCQFFQANLAPERIILQVFVALVRACEPEHRMLVNQALDILMPTLPESLPPRDNPTPIWIRYTKKFLIEEGNSLQNLIHILQLIVRHSDLFCDCGAQFVPQMVNSLSRLGLSFTATIENRHLAIELSGMVARWEKRRQSELNDVAGTDVNPNITSPPGSICTQPDDEKIINFLIRVALVIELRDKEAILMYKQALHVLSQALDVWPHANVKFNYFEKLLSSIQPSQSGDISTAVVQGLHVMDNVLEKQAHPFIRNNISQISQVIEACFKHKWSNTRKLICSLLKIIFLTFPLDSTGTPPDVKILHQKVQELIHKQIAEVTAPGTSGNDTSAKSIRFLLMVLETLMEVQKNLIDPPWLVRVLQWLSR